MRLRMTLTLLVLAAVITLGTHQSSGLMQDGPPPGGIAERYKTTADQILAATSQSNASWSKLERLCDDIGHRLSGSESLDRAIAWAVETLKADGQENVRAEAVMVPRWVRGRESIVMVEPRHQRIALLGLGGSVGTPPGGITAEVVVVQDEEELEALGEGAKGKIVLFDNHMPDYDPEKGSGYGQTVRFRVNGARLAAAQGAVACLVRSVTAKSLRSPHTGGMRYGDAKRRIPAAAVSTEDASLIARLTAAGRQVVVRLEMDARSEGEVASANVVAELRGKEMPEEVVVIGGHIDSWDVGQGAHDDGAGCVIAMEALAVLRRLGLRPRRTIRVVLWTNEENGLAGAKAYARDHAEELKGHVAAIESDSGGFSPLGFSVDLEDDEAEGRAAERLRDLLTLLAPIGATEVRTGFAGADVSPLRPHGVATLGLRVEGSRYFDYHHSKADTLDKVNPDELTRCTASMAVLSYVLADMPFRLGE